MAAASAGLERAREGRGKERERVKRAGELGSLYLCTARRRAGGHASSKGKRAQHVDCSSCARCRPSSSSKLNELIKYHLKNTS